MNEAIKDIIWSDLIGNWSSKQYDFAVLVSGRYTLYNYDTENRNQGKINSFYNNDRNTVSLILESFGTVELFQIHDKDIDLYFNGEHHLFKKHH